MGGEGRRGTKRGKKRERKEKVSETMALSHFPFSSIVTASESF